MRWFVLLACLAACAAVFVVAVGEDRALLGYSEREGSFQQRRAFVRSGLDEGGSPTLLSGTANVVCVDGIHPAHALKRWKQAFDDRLRIQDHRSPANDSSVSVLLGYEDGTSEVFYFANDGRRQEHLRTHFGEAEVSFCDFD